MKQGEAGNTHSHDFLHVNEGEGSFKRRDLWTRDFVLCQMSNSQWGRLRLATAGDISYPMYLSLLTVAELQSSGPSLWSLTYVY